MVNVFFCGQTQFILLVIGELGSRPSPSHLTNKLGMVNVVLDLKSIRLKFVFETINNNKIALVI